MSQPAYPRTRGIIIPVSQEDIARLQVSMDKILTGIRQLNNSGKVNLLNKVQQKHGGIFLGANRKGIS